MAKWIVRAALALVALLVVAALAAVFLTQRPIDLADFPEPAQIAPPPTANAAVRFTILPTATFSAPEGAVYEGGNWFARRPMAHSAVLICHPQALVIFDTGLGREVDAQFGEFPAMTRAMVGNYQKRTPLADAIAALDPCPGRRRVVIPSHLHWDHAGGIEDLPGAEVWVADGEREQARSGGVRQGFLPSQLDAEDIDWRPIAFASAPYEHYPRSLDVFGDGALVLVPMAGHTAGSVGLFVTAAGQRYFFTGDTSWVREGFTRPAHKFFAARAMADLNLEELDAEIVGVHRLMLRDPGLTVIPAHDSNAYPAESIYPNWVGAPAAR